MNDEKFVYRYYKISINLGPFSFYSNTSSHKILRGPLTILIGFGYSLITIFLGFLGGFNLYKKSSGIRNSLEALHINLTGGDDISKLIMNDNYDSRTIYIFNNLLRQTTEKINLEEINIIVEIQDHYIETNTNRYNDVNIDFVVANLAKLKIFHVRRTDIKDVFDAMSLYDKYALEVISS